METPWFSCFCALLPTVRFSFPMFNLHPGMFIFFVSLRLCSSHLLLSASTYSIVRVFSACVFCNLPHLGILLFFIRLVFFFRSSYFSGGVFLLCSRTRYASTWFAYLDSLAFGFSLTVWTQNLYLSRVKNKEGHWGYCWCRWVERTVWCENNNNNSSIS